VPQDITETSGAHATDSESELESDSDKEVALSDPEDDILELKQPALGWAHAERQLPGYSKTNTGKTRHSKYYQNKKRIETEKEKEKLQRTYGDLSRWFNPPATSGPITRAKSPTPPPVADPTPSLPETLPPIWLLPSQALPSLSLTPPSHSTALLQPSSSAAHAPSLPSVATGALDFETTFFRPDKLTNEIKDLENWLKKNKAKVTGDWLKRVQGTIGLLRFHGSKSSGYHNAEPAKRRHDWTEHSKSIAISLGKGHKYAQALRRWERDWFETRTPPSCPQRGRHVKRTSLFNDEGVSTRPNLIARCSRS
jgi:hypothetical protein